MNFNGQVDVTRTGTAGTEADDEDSEGREGNDGTQADEDSEDGNVGIRAAGTGANEEDLVEETIGTEADEESEEGNEGIREVAGTDSGDADIGTREQTCCCDGGRGTSKDM